MKAGPTELESIVQANKGLLKPSKAGRRKATYRKEKSWAPWVKKFFEGALFILVKLKLRYVSRDPTIYSQQSYEIKSPPWTILWFIIVGIFSVENIDRLGVFMLQT